ncbi:MAG: threonylcarbamoyl-AMP synthase [Flavobacteriales bacterium]|nr:threonylcarbamoyl-AMP synthase [Flavobacteriales bacterium]
MNKEELKEAVRILRSGGVILYPTDTIWGLGCDATNQEAVDRLRAVKGREEGKAMLVLVAEDGMLQRYVKDVPKVAWDLIDCADKPTTIIYPEGIHFAEGVTAEDGSIGIRKTDDETCVFMIKGLNKPLVSTSANFAGQPSPSVFREISEELKNKVDYIVPFRQDEQGGRASAVIKLGLGGQISILRK